MKVSLIASSVRANLYEAFFKSLEGTSVDYEVVFAGNNPLIGNPYPNLRYIETANIKPAQCYEVARRAATGDLIQWTADDALYTGDVLGKAVRFWESLNNPKVILSLVTKERYTENFFLTDLNAHTLKGPNTPLMAPFALVNREYLEDLQGFDRRYICGQYENDVVMRIYRDGGELVQFTEAPIIVDHFIGHGGVTTTEGYNRPFAKGYPHDRAILENSWMKNGVFLNQKPYRRFDAFEPYEDINLTTKTQSYTIKSIWSD